MKQWLESNTVRYLFFTWLASLIAQFAAMLGNPPVNWKLLLVQALIALAGIVKRMVQPDVVAPLDILNRSNPKE